MGVLALLSFGATFYQEGAKHEAVLAMNQSKLDAERLLGEKLQLEKSTAELDQRVGSGSQALSASERTVEELRQRVEAAVKHAHGLEGAARRNNKSIRELADLKAQYQQLEAQLNAAKSNERIAQEQLDRITKERDRLSAQLDEQGQAAQMVNNAEVEALRGRKQRLTVMARHTKEIRMAFDLPEGLAKGASFKIITPAGRNYSGADPEISLSMGNAGEEPVASLMAVSLSAPKERAARVQLRFKPESKLEAGTYRIDVMSGGAYLNTVLLNLR